MGPLLFAWLLFSIYKQVMAQPHLETSWLQIKHAFNSSRILGLFAVALLMFVNWGLEAEKWRLSVKTVYPVSFFNSFKAVLSGVSFAVTTPNRMGEYVGRMMYLPEGNRLKTISVTLVGSMSQLFITIFCGTIGVVLLKDVLIREGFVNEITYRLAITVLVGVLVVYGIFYFRVAVIENIFERWMKNSSYLYLIESLRSFNVQLLGRLLLLSFLRYLVFVAQYYLLFHFYGIELSFGIIWSVVSVLFLAMAVIPSIALVEVGLRGEISLRLMALFTNNSLGVGLTSVTIWLINLILPAVAGSVLILSIKVFNRKNDNF